MSVMADPLLQCADLDVRDKEVICSFAVPVKFLTLQVVTSEDRAFRSEQTLVSTSHNKRLSQLQSSDSLTTRSLRSLLTSPFDELFCLSLVMSNN
jgi:hypothetical protein